MKEEEFSPKTLQVGICMQHSQYQPKKGQRNNEPQKFKVIYLPLQETGVASLIHREPISQKRGHHNF